MGNNNAHSISSIDGCRLIPMQVFPDVNGKLAVIENGPDTPFEIKRMFFLYDVPSGAVRGGHSHFEMQELLVAVSGSLDVVLNDGIQQKRVTLNKPNEALLIPAGIWRELDNFTSGAVCVALASTNFSEADYVRDFNQFLSLTADKRQ